MTEQLKLDDMFQPNRNEVKASFLSSFDKIVTVGKKPRSHIVRVYAGSLMVLGVDCGEHRAEDIVEIPIGRLEEIANGRTGEQEIIESPDIEDTQGSQSDSGSGVSEV